MSAHYKKLEIVATNGDDGFVVFCTTQNYDQRQNEVYDWIQRLANSIGLKGYRVEVSDSNWTMATIRKDRLFETHYPDVTIE